MSFIRKTVSKKKRRYQKGGFDLDLAYITKQLIAMGFPSESVEGVYRNPFKEVFRFLELTHKDHYKVYNLCSERSYDASKFHNRVELFPFDDHNCPTLELIMKFCANVKEYLSADERNVAVIHCKAGKGRTGLMICCYMIYSGEWTNPKDALDFYAAMRTYNKKGVTIPSQVRYVYYTGHIMSQWGGLLPKPKTLLLKSIIFHSIPKLSQVADIKFSIYVFKTLVFTSKEPPKIKGQKKKGQKKAKDEEEEEETLNFDIPMLPLCGDIKLDFYEKDSFGSDRVLCCWFNTLFVGTNNILEIKKDELDKAAKDKHSKIFKENFKVELQFESMDSEVKVEKVAPQLEVPLSPRTEKRSSFLLDKDKELTSTDEEDEVATAENGATDQNRDPCLVVEFLLKQLIEIRILHENMSDADFKRRDEFLLFEQSLLDLTDVSFEKLTSPQHKVTFWVNVFNLMTMFATCKRPKEELTPLTERLHYFSTFSLSGMLFSLTEVMFAVLRGNLELPEFLSDKAFAEYVRKFPKDDPRAEHVLSVKDPRILFAMCEGTSTSPLLHIFHPDKFYDEVEEATRSFLSNQVSVNQDAKQIVLPQLLEFYYKDFGKTPEKMLKALHNYLTSDQKAAVSSSFQIKYNEFDWKCHYSLKHLVVE